MALVNSLGLRHDLHTILELLTAKILIRNKRLKLWKQDKTLKQIWSRVNQNPTRILQIDGPISQLHPTHLKHGKYQFHVATTRKKTEATYGTYSQTTEYSHPMNFLSACGTSASARKQQPKRSEKEVKLDQTTSKSNETWILAPLQLGESITTRISPKGPRDSPPVSWIWEKGWNNSTLGRNSNLGLTLLRW